MVSVEALKSGVVLVNVHRSVVDDCRIRREGRRAHGAMDVKGWCCHACDYAHVVCVCATVCAQAE